MDGNITVSIEMTRPMIEKLNEYRRLTKQERQLRSSYGKALNRQESLSAEGHEYNKINEQLRQAESILMVMFSLALPVFKEGSR